MLTATGHPLQRAGAWAVAVMAGRSEPELVTAADLDGVVEAVVADAVAAAVAGKDAARYAWWKVLYALYPNSKVTHAKRPKDAAVLTAGMTELFVPDDAEGERWPCALCGAVASVVWAKSTLPMFDTNKALNTLPPGVSGWPVCRGCRVAMWALPYGAWVTAGSATVLSCVQRQAEREFAEHNVQRAKRMMHAGASGMAADASPELVVVRALRALGPGLAATTLWSFKNDNQEPWVRVTRTRRAVPVFLASVSGNAPLRRGWQLLAHHLKREDADGQVTAYGAAEAARLLFEAEDGRSRSLLRQVYELLWETERWTAEDRAALTRLAFVYEKEVHGVEPDLSKVATLIADWIEHGSSSPRGQLAEYRKAALNGYRLGELLLEASFRLKLDGRPVAIVPEEWRLVVQQRSRAWEQRVLLAAEVLRLLQDRGVEVGKQPDDPAERELTEQRVQQPILAPEDHDFHFGAA
ncbi:hypothetical protein [Streptomyces synnematoformans]|uniref:hypothetical protein n=1 Tax=Streptomyces synnematoformans TaxID=415721 RepID=UPI0031D67516